MIKFTKKLALAFSFMLLYSSQFMAMGSDIDIPMLKRQLGTEVTGPGDSRFGAGLPLNLMIKIFRTAADEGANPRCIALTCQDWNKIMHGELEGAEGDTHFVRAQNQKIGIPYPELNSFMKDCMHRSWQARFRNGVLRYTPEDGGAVVELKFSDLAASGTFDLSKCGDRSQHIRITTSVEEFFKVRGENEGRLVVLTCPYHVALQAIQLNPAHPFSRIMTSWDRSKAPVGMFWRWGDWNNASWFDYLVTMSMKGMSEKNFYENWEKSVVVASVGIYARLWSWMTCRSFRAHF